MKTDKKKLMRKLIAVGLMASMLTANTMTYGSELILPGINAEALSAEAETKLASITETYDISTLAQDFVATPENGGVIRINIDKNGTYKFTGRNYKEADGGCYIDVQVTVKEGVTANFIFDGLQVKNSSQYSSLDCGDVFKYAPFCIEGTVNLYIKDNSSLGINDDSYEYANCFYSNTKNGVVNVIESENNAKLKFLHGSRAYFNMKGGCVECSEIGGGGAVAFSGGVFVGGLSYPDSYYAVIDGGYVDINYIAPSFVTFKNSSGDSVYSTTISGLPANAKVTELNGKELNATYTDANGELKTYLPDLSQAAFLVVVGGVEYLCISPSGDTSSGFNYSAVSMTEIVGTYKFAKTYDGTTALTPDMASGETALPDTVTVTPDLTDIAAESVNAGESTVTVPVTLAYNGTTYNIELDIPVEITPAPLTISSAAVEDKVYDSTTDATVTGIVLSGLIGTDVLTSGTDYTVTAAFADKDAGTDKTVNVTVTLADTVKNYALEANTVTAKASIIADDVSGTANNGAGTFTYESVDPVSPLVKAEGEPDGSDFMIIEKDQNQTTTTYYFVYKVKLSDLAGKSTGTVYIALSEDGEQTRKFATNDIFESVTIEGKLYTPPEGYYYMVYAVSDVPNTEQLFCSAKVQLS